MLSSLAYQFSGDASSGGQMLRDAAWSDWRRKNRVTLGPLSASAFILNRYCFTLTSGHATKRLNPLTKYLLARLQVCSRTVRFSAYD